MSRFVLAFLLAHSVLLADDPAPTPPAATLSVPDGVTGTGTRKDPYRYDVSSIPLVMLVDDTVKDLAWDLVDAPEKSIVIPGGRAVAFPLVLGEYLIEATWTGGREKAWIQIHTGPAPPKPPETVASRVTKALTGERATEDAVALVAASEKILEGLATYRDGAELLTQWGALLKANGWVKGARPEIAAMIGAEIPPGEAVPFTAADKARIKVLFEGVLAGSKGALK